MKTIFTLVALVVTGMANSSLLADIRLGAPGVPAGARVATKVPFKISYSLPPTYKFVFRGIEARGDTLGAPGSSGTSGNGGQFHLKATVSTSIGSERAGQLYFRNVQEYNRSESQTLLICQEVFKATNHPICVTVEWQGGGNAHKPNGFFNILGEHQLAPPVPVGKLDFAVGDLLLEAAGSQPPGTATIDRD